MTSSNFSSAQQPSLYCLNCEQTNRINGEWIIRIQLDFVEYECPACGSVIESRSDWEALKTQSEEHPR